MDPRVERFLTRLQETGFADLRGATATVTLPVADRLLNEVIAEQLPASGRIREVRLHARDGNRVDVRIKIGDGVFPPPVNLSVAIERQPQLPASPVLVLRLQLGGFLSMMGAVMGFLDHLPPGIRVERDLVYVDLAALLAERGLRSWLDYVDEMVVTTVEGAVLVAIAASVRPGGSPA